ncbi:hypothetical protein Cylst_4627 [Cylindrospermum stagnale PCC 7417]|uniref:eCIS core domain-containing protein n=1 Tax=Cylindrospermum stagnale PCC 7417 TaxID=56107 RepID=K9X4W2_9NOST|nr:DUF4157 domain-containing protein [Cylindrospermum stagnale]AFZ26697.1 hypothetical protein Cylst_4627 [Cylindrospermum stagnale PCC 7417]
MYSGQHRTSKKSSNSSDKPVPSRFAPRGFVVQPKTEEVTPQQDQTPEEQTQREEPNQYKSGFIDSSKWRPGPPARTPRIQMKLTRLQSGDMYQQQPVSSNPVVIQPQANTDLSPEQNSTLEPFEKADEVANEGVEIQRLSESGESGDEDSNSANGGTVQRACSLCETEKSLVQTKLTIGSTGDKYEQEADSMAERVMSMDTPTATNGHTIQRLGEEQEQPQQPLSASVTPLVQRLSELVQRMAEVKASTNETLVNSNKEPLFTSKQDHVESTQLPWLQPKHINRVNSRPGTEAKYLDNRSHTDTSTAEEQPIQRLTDETLQRSGNSDTTPATPSLESRLGSQTGGGSPLDEQTRSFMESGFGADFNQVRVHTDTTAVQMNKELGAQAFTHGHDVYFGAGKAPGKNELTAHELTHVVQQGGAVQRKLSASQDKSLLIQKAELAQDYIQRQGDNSTQIIDINTSGAVGVDSKQEYSFTIPISGDVGADKFLVISIMWIFSLNQNDATKVRNKYIKGWKYYRKPTEEELKNKVRLVLIDKSLYEAVKTDLYGTDNQTTNNSPANLPGVNGGRYNSIHNPSSTNLPGASGGVSGSRHNPSSINSPGVNSGVSDSMLNNNPSNPVEPKGKYGTGNQSTGNALTTEGRRQKFDNLVKNPDGILPQRILTATASKIYNETHRKNPVSLDTLPGNNQEWDLILDRLLQERELLNGLPNEIKQVLGGQALFDSFPQDYQQLLRIARNLNKLPPELRSSVKPLNSNDIYSPGGLDTYEQYVSDLSKNSGISSALSEGKSGTTTEQTEKEQLSRLPENIKSLLGAEESFQPNNYQQLLRIAEKLKQFGPEDFAVYKLLTIKATDKLDLFEKSLDMYLARKEELKKALAEQQQNNPKEPTMQDAINEKWQGLDESAVGNMSEDKRYQLARQKTSELTEAQLKFMQKHPGQTLTDFAKSATLMNTGETFNATSKDLIEAASGDANAWARWAAGAGAGAKISGWLLAVGGILYVASWLTGVGELATIAAAAAVLLGATVILSVAESELRIKAASQAKEPEEFKRNVELAAAARTNVILAVSMIVVAAVLHFTAKALFPKTVQNINTSLKNFRERIRLKGSVSELKPEIVQEMGLRKGELAKATELAKQKTLDAAKDLEGLNTEQFVETLEKGDSGFMDQSKLPPEQRLNYRELLRTPEGRAAIEGYKQKLVNALKIDVVAEIEKLSQEYASKIDEFLKDIDAAKNHDDLKAATNKTEGALTEENMKKFMQEEQENITNRKLEEAVNEAHKETHIELEQLRVSRFLGNEIIRGISTNDVHILNLLDDQALNILAGASNTQLIQAIALARRNTKALNVLLVKYGKDLVGKLSSKTFAQYLPDIIEVGAGEGNYSQFLKKEFLYEGEEFLATDFAQEAGKGNFLLNAEKSGIATRYGIDANQLHELFEPESARIIVGANPYGNGPKNPGQSYGLTKFTGKGQNTAADNRFLLSAYQILQPEGKVIIRCKSNIIRKYINKSTLISNQQKQQLSQHFPNVEGTNPYTRVKPEDLLEFAKIGYEITVTPTSPPEGASFGRPDTNPGQGIKLNPFNVEITFQKSNTPSVNYIIEDKPFVEQP